jgi:hypothetical protein
MTYTTNMPLVGQNINVTQPLIEGNFNYLATFAAGDHTPFNSTPIGTHQAIHLEQQGGVFPGADPLTSSSEIAFYNKLDNLTPTQFNRLWIRLPSNGAVLQWTGNVINAQNTGVGVNCGETMILGGIVVKYGNVPVSSSGTTFTWTSIGLSNFPNNCYGVSLTPTAATTSSAASGTTTNFTAKVGSSTNCFFIAFGN